MANQFASSVLSTTLSTLKNFYAETITTQFNDDCPGWKFIQRGSEKASGLQVIRGIKVRRNQGVGSTSDGGLLPAIGVQGSAQAILPFKYMYLRAGMTGPMLEASKTDKGAFISEMRFAMEGGLDDLTTQVNRAVWWTGTGQVATVSTNAVASTVIVATGRTSGEAGNKYLDAGAVIDIISTAGVVMASAVTIVSYTGTTTMTMTLSTAVTTNATDIIVYSGSYNNDLQGYKSCLDGGTGVLFNINRATYPVYQGNYFASTTQLTLDQMQQSFNAPRQRGGAKTNLIACDFDSERYYNKLLVANKRFVGAQVAGDGSFTQKDKQYLEFAGLPIMADKDVPFAHFFFLDTDHFKKYVLGTELSWADETGSFFIAQTGTDSFELRLRLWANLFPEKPSAQALLLNYLAP